MTTTPKKVKGNLREAMQRAKKQALKDVGSTEPESPTFLPLSKIEVPTTQPRRYFDQEKIQELTKSIQQHGVLQPVLVRPLESGMYELVAGERRYRAAKAALLSDIPVYVKVFSEKEAVQFALLENLQREDLDPVEETEAIISLLALHLEVNSDEAITLLHRMRNEKRGKVASKEITSKKGKTVEELFESLGTISWPSFVATRLPLLNLPEDVLRALRTGSLAYTKAKEIARLPDETERAILLKKVVQDNLSLADVRVKVKNLLPTITSHVDKSLAGRALLVARRLRKAKTLKNRDVEAKVEVLLTDLEKLLEGLAVPQS